MAKIIFAKQNREPIFVAPGETLMKALLAQQIPVASSCKGDGVCGKCRLKIVAGGQFLSAVSERETFLIEKNKLPKDNRISCQVIVEAGDEGEVILDAGYW